MSTDVDVLVVGAGPTGLTTALQAHDHGASVRVMERRPEAFRPSRAMILHPRTLESLRPLGVVDELLDRADRAPRASVHLGRRVVDVRLTDVTWPGTPYPHLTLVRQADVEAVLGAALQERGVTVERDAELVTASTTDDAARAEVRVGGSVQQVTSRFVAGCDGPASTVRRIAGVGWRGGPYREEVVLADVELDAALAPGLLHVVVGRPGLVFLFALGEGATWRVLATRATTGHGAPFGQPGEPVPASEVHRLLEAAGLPAAVTDLRWSARVRLQHRMAGAFRRGRLFLAGDAAHAHSPAAAQGMNTGILDGVNLGWKLAFAASGCGDPEALLDSYGLERRPVDRRVLALTHLVFYGEASTTPLPTLLRGTLLPWAAPLVPTVTAQPRVMALLVRLLSQDWTNYRSSPVSADGTSARRSPRPGRHLPDRAVVHEGRRRRLHELTAHPGIHLLLDRDAPAPDARGLGPWVSTHRLQSSPGHGLVAVRPDGFVGFGTAERDPEGLARWLERVCTPERVVRAEGPLSRSSSPV
ncbi:FAD-dependent monooxygenase [Isoptericola sp. b408]|uniref:FAD-dependent monooxygenase n=1 Tax=Isoptericola sp. b408 TaxID=3064653 RepID=UPI002713AC54|nr:FAD-dependent monooxygenase [Isoptericola sp. b408]MDO8150943.1 FAD-dependent monooxygenase [Isoptericola sp. b408]